jgi:hypothetical protein
MKQRRRIRPATIGQKLPKIKPSTGRAVHAVIGRRSEALRMQHILGLDHVIILVRDLDDADARMARLGFRPTPRG